MSFSHLLILGVILIIFIPPEKLPEVMRNIARVFNEFRRSTSGVWDEIKKDAELKPSDLFKAPPAAQPPQPPVAQPQAVTEEKKHDSNS